MAFLDYDGLRYFYGKIVARLNAKANMSTVLSLTIPASGWAGSSAPFTNTITATGVTENNWLELTTPAGITGDEIEALANADIRQIGQGTDSMTFYAHGDKPTIDVPITIIIRGDIE